MQQCRSCNASGPPEARRKGWDCAWTTLPAPGPQFTRYGDVRKGRRPSFDTAATPDVARLLYEDLVRELRAVPLPVATGEFQAMMRVELVNDGPVTLWLER